MRVNNLKFVNYSQPTLEKASSSYVYTKIWCGTHTTFSYSVLQKKRKYQPYFYFETFFLQFFVL